MDGDVGDGDADSHAVDDDIDTDDDQHGTPHAASGKRASSRDKGDLVAAPTSDVVKDGPMSGIAPESKIDALAAMCGKHLSLKSAKRRRLSKKAPPHDASAAPPIVGHAAPGGGDAHAAAPSNPAMKRPAAAPVVAKAVAPVVAKPAVMPRDGVKMVVYADTSKYPPMTLDSPVAWRGGKIYHSVKKCCFRSYRRVEDKVEAACGYGKHGTVADKRNAWAKACKAIKDDPRPF
jgi:hypothetical protein